LIAIITGFTLLQHAVTTTGGNTLVAALVIIHVVSIITAFPRALMTITATRSETVIEARVSV
tara:strand:- start:174 stop:359 length:186 start_codon:yes stop_codon:yes gene_type:complete